jgi:hypothetical protein
MPAELFAMIIKGFVLSTVLALGFCAGSEQGKAGLPSHVPSGDPWDRLLALALKHTPEAEEIIRQTAAKPPSPEAGKLAEVLLEEWDLPRDHEALRKPRLVFMPEMDRSGLPEIQGFPPLIPLSGTVDTRGFVRDPVLLKPSTNPWAQRALDQFSHARFRPARGPRGYVAKPFQMLATLHPR